MSDPNEIDYRIEWLQSYVDADDPAVLPPPPDSITAAAAALGDAFGWWYDPVLGPSTVLEMAEIVSVVLSDQAPRTPS